VLVLRATLRPHHDPYPHKERPAVTAWDSILPEAERLVHGDRGDTYGPPWDDYARVVETFNALADQDLTVEEGLLFMVSVKLGRLSHGLAEGLPPERLRDSIVDACGYLDCLWGALTAGATDASP
jgi:hypothetical protein